MHENEPQHHPHDVEKGGHIYKEKVGAPVYVDETGAVPAESFAIGDTLYAKIQRVAGKYGVEQRGIERVPENERSDTNLVKIGTMVCCTRYAQNLQQELIGL